VFFPDSVAADRSDHRREANQQRRFFACSNCARQGRFLEQPEQFEHDYDNDNYSNDIEDASVHVGANIKLGVWWPAFMQIKRGRRTRISCLINLVYGIERSVTGQHRYSQPADSAQSTELPSARCGGRLVIRM
jgi:hypothetical protein